MKQDWKPGTLIYPLPAVMVSCGTTPEEYNIITVAWVGTLCGIRSGKNNNKFEVMNLTPGKSKVIKTPIIEESPISIECRVKEIVPLGSHHMFIADIVHIQADNKYFDPSTGQFDMQKANLIAYAHGNYYELTKHIGKFGWSVEKKKAKATKARKNR